MTLLLDVHGVTGSSPVPRTIRKSPEITMISGLSLLATKENPRLCRGEKIAYGEGQSRQEKVSKLE